MKTVIHVNQHVIKRNMKEGRNDPAIIIRDYKGSKLAYEAEVGGVRVVQARGKIKPLSCGARVWIETQAEVRCR